MKPFLDQDFLLKNDTAKKLYHEFAEKMPILDYHCHINPSEIANNRKFENITQVWLGGDHYKWRLMRANGVDERFITGDAPDKEKFKKFAECLEKAIGNPVYHWSHLELQRYFGYNKPLSSANYEEVWDICNAALQKDDMSVRSIIKRSNVQLICTTDDPIDDLKWHQAIKADKSFDVQVLPAWRPDKAMNIEKTDYLSYIDSLSNVSQVKICSFESLKKAIIKRMDYFSENGCLVSDHGLEYIMNFPASDEEISEIFQKRLKSEKLEQIEMNKFKTAFMCFVGREYYKRNWIMQLHYGCKRDNNTLLFNQLGPDTGLDCINNYAPSSQIADFLNHLNISDELPKTILYSLNPNDNAAIVSIIGCFQDSSAIGKIQHGSAWWFNDHKIGMLDQMSTLATIGMLGNFNGMLTDSRSFLSYTRHEYFRRILCNLLGTWVEDGEYPADYKVLSEIVRGISYNNAIKYFNFNLKQQ